MKFFGIVSTALAVSVGIATAAPMTGATAAPMAGAPSTHLDFARDTAATNAIEIYAEFNRGGALGPLTGLLKALPAPLSNALQAAVAELFKAGDVVLNIPLDAIELLIKGDVGGALGSIVKNAGGTLGSLPGDLTKALGLTPPPKKD